MTTREGTRARERLLTADSAAATVNTACEQIMLAFHDIACFDRAALMTTDPETLLPAGGIVEGFDPSACAPFWDNELLDPDFNKFAELARRIDPVATLADAVDGDLIRSPRYQKIYRHLDVSDELRVVFLSGTSCLAVGAFLRSDGRVFTPAEVAAVRELVPLVTSTLRRAHGRTVYSAKKGSPAVIVLDGRGEPIGMTPYAEQVLNDLRKDFDDGVIPGVIQVAAAKARWARTSTSLTTRVWGRNGQWLRIHVSPMDGKVGEIGATVLTIEAARPDDLMPILLDAYGLTERETEVVVHLCRGHSIKEIATDLELSPHTVRDHVKAIHEKAGVNSRSELIANLFSNHLLHRLEANVQRA